MNRGSSLSIMIETEAVLKAVRSNWQAPAGANGSRDRRRQARGLELGARVNPRWEFTQMNSEMRFIDAFLNIIPHADTMRCGLPRAAADIVPEL